MQHEHKKLLRFASSSSLESFCKRVNNLSLKTGAFSTCFTIEQKSSSKKKFQKWKEKLLWMVHYYYYSLLQLSSSLHHHHQFASLRKDAQKDQEYLAREAHYLQSIATAVDMSWNKNLYFYPLFSLQWTHWAGALPPGRPAAAVYWKAATCSPLCCWGAKRCDNNGSSGTLRICSIDRSVTQNTEEESESPHWHTVESKVLIHCTRQRLMKHGSWSVLTVHGIW